MSELRLEQLTKFADIAIHGYSVAHGTTPDGSIAVWREAEPAFMFVAPTLPEARQRAEAALDFYRTDLALHHKEGC